MTSEVLSVSGNGRYSMGNGPTQETRNVDERPTGERRSVLGGRYRPDYSKQDEDKLTVPEIYGALGVFFLFVFVCAYKKPRRG